MLCQIMRRSSNVCRYRMEERTEDRTNNEENVYVKYLEIKRKDIFDIFYRIDILLCY